MALLGQKSAGERATWKWPTRQDSRVDIWARSKWCLENAPRRVGYGHCHPYQELGVRGVYSLLNALVEDKVYRVREWGFSDLGVVDSPHASCCHNATVLGTRCLYSTNSPRSQASTALPHPLCTASRSCAKGRNTTSTSCPHLPRTLPLSCAIKSIASLGQPPMRMQLDKFAISNIV